MAIAAAGVLTIAAVSPTEPHSPPAAVSDIRLAAATATTPAVPPPGALIEQFLANQIQNCSLICPFIVQGAIQVPVNFALIPLTLIGELQSAPSLLQAIALTDATVSGAANAALTGIITNDLGLVLPRAQNALEIAVVGLIDIGTTAFTQPANLLEAINTARTNLFDALTQPPGTMPPPAVHNGLEAAAVRAIEVASSLTFQAPERLLLGITQAVNAFFTSLGNTGDFGAALGAVGTSVSVTVGDSVAFIRHALTEPIPITPSAATVTSVPSSAVTSTTTTPIATAHTQTPTTKAPAVSPQLLRSSLKTGNDAVATQPSFTTVPTTPTRTVRTPEHIVNRVVTSPGSSNHHTEQKPGH
ncbi:MAG: hypothetical protein JO044_06355 [Mycobacteriaceae bacterium]|nr:hypothetical protein [Mycobacteriaceae bacterium]MBV9641157.1 hypothetical protein [Mycobacteriaceae bacterium]